MPLVYVVLIIDTADSVYYNLLLLFGVFSLLFAGIAEKNNWQGKVKVYACADVSVVILIYLQYVILLWCDLVFDQSGLAQNLLVV